MSPHGIISSLKSRMWAVPSKSNCAFILQHPTALLTHIYFATPYGQLSAAMQPYLHAFHLTLRCIKLSRIKKKKKHVQNKHPCEQPVLITSLMRKENKKNLFSPQGYPVRRQGQRLSRRRKGLGGTTKAARQYRFAGNPDIEIERSEAAQDAALPDQCVVCRRLSLKMRAKLKSCYLSYDAISDKHSKKGKTRARERERQRARVRAWEQLQFVRQSAGIFLLLFTFSVQLPGHSSTSASAKLRGIKVYPISKQLSAQSPKQFRITKQQQELAKSSLLFVSPTASQIAKAYTCMYVHVWTRIELHTGDSSFAHAQHLFAIYFPQEAKE